MLTAGASRFITGTEEEQEATAEHAVRLCGVMAGCHSDRIMKLIFTGRSGYLAISLTIYRMADAFSCGRIRTLSISSRSNSEGYIISSFSLKNSGRITPRAVFTVCIQMADFHPVRFYGYSFLIHLTPLRDSIR